VPVEFQDLVTHGIAFKYCSIPLSDLSLEELRHVIGDLNNLSEQLGCVVFEANGRSKSDLVIFGGNLERFSMLSVARGLDARVFYFQDTKSWWYGGSELLPDIKGIAAFLHHHIGSRHCLTFGQSSGGYAALAVGALNPHYDVLACSPQTFPDRLAKSRLNISAWINVRSTPDYLLDLQAVYDNSYRTGFAAALFSVSEHLNPSYSYFWMDHLHMAKLAPVPSIDVFMAASSNHPMVLHRAPLFSEYLKQLIDASGKRTQVKREIVKKLIMEIKPVVLPEHAPPPGV